MPKRVIVKQWDEIVEIKRLECISYESEATNIALDFDEIFKISVFDKVTKLMRYYEIEGGKIIFISIENLGEN